MFRNVRAIVLSVLFVFATAYANEDENEQYVDENPASNQCYTNYNSCVDKCEESENESCSDMCEENYNKCLEILEAQ